MNRRLFLQTGALIGVGSFLPRWTRRALADEPTGRKTLVFLFLRGALDGLHAVAPVGDGRYFDVRPQLAPRELDLLPLEPGFALHPALDALLPFWRNSSLAIVHAVGSPDPTRSHFEAQDFLESGTPGVKTTPDGWLARSLHAVHAAPTSSVDAAAIASRLPRALQGAPDALALSSLDQLRLRSLAAGRGPGAHEQAEAAFEAMYRMEPDTDPVAVTGKKAFATVKLLQGTLPAPGLDYPNGPIAGSLRQVARLIKADVGLRVACAEAGGWDTHVAQARQLETNLRHLGDALAAFMRDLGPHAADVVLVAATEFGRTVRQNGTNGTDHGHASVAFVLGGGVRGGRVHGRWPGLRDDELYEGRDLAVTTDLRSVLAATAAAQLGVGDIGKVFPGFSGQPLSSLFHSQS